jgi:hypothetical protein
MINRAVIRIIVGCRGVIECDFMNVISDIVDIRSLNSSGENISNP